MAPHRYRIFISSPGDMKAERTLTRNIIARVDESLPGIELEPYFSEDELYFGYQGPQEGIPLSSDFDLVICLFWKRIGTLLLPEKFNAPDGRPRTGSEFEFETAVAAARRSQDDGSTPVPGVLVYRKTAREISLPDHDSEYAQYRALEEFFKRWIKDEQGHYLGYANCFDTTPQFGRTLERHLRDWLTLQRRAVDWDIAARGSPFRGLEVFDRPHQSVFFGRDRSILQARARLKKAAEDGFPALWIVGASGSGKSSLLRAGLLPSLERSEGDLRSLVFKPSELGEILLAGLAAQLLGVLPELQQGSFPDPHSLALLLAAATPQLSSQALEVALHRWAAADATALQLDPLPRTRLLIAIDQAEELLTLRTPAERSQLAALLQHWLENDRVWLVLSFRSDFYSTLQRDGLLLPLKHRAAQLDIAELSPAEVTRIIQEPCRAAGLTLEVREDGVALLDELSKDAGAADSLPMLQFALQALFELAQARGDQILRLNDYVNMKRAAGALSAAAETRFLNLPRAVQDAFPALLRELVDLNLQAVNRAPTAKSCPRSRFANDPVALELIAELCDPRQRLLSEFDISGEPHVRVVHESLFQHWTRAQEQIAKDARRLDARRRLEEAAALWAAEQEVDERKKRLLGGLDLEEGLDLASAWNLPSNLTDYVRCSHAAQKSRDRLRLIGIAAMAIVVLVAMGLALNIVRMAREVRELDVRMIDAKISMIETRDEAAGRSFGRARQEMEAGNLPVQKAYLAEALNYFPARDVMPTASIVLQQSEADPLRLVFKYQASDRFVLFSPDGRRVLGTGNDNKITLRDTRTGQRIGDLPESKARVVFAMFTPDAAKIVTVRSDKTAQVWDAASQKAIGEKLEFGDYNFSFEKFFPAVSPDGNLLAKLDVGKVVKVFDLRKGGRPVAVLPADHDGFPFLQFSPDSAQLFVAPVSGEAQIWVLPENKKYELKDMRPVRLGRFSSDGKRFVTLGNSGEARVWSLKNGVATEKKMSLDSDFVDARFSPEGSRLVLMDRAGVLKIVEMNSGAVEELPFRGETGAGEIAFSPDGRRILVWNRSSVNLWDLYMKAEVGEPLRHPDYVVSARFSPDGAQVTTISADKAIRIWDVRSGAAVNKRLGGPPYPKAISFSADGRRLLVVAYNVSKIWDISREGSSGIEILHAFEVAAASFSSDSLKILAASSEGDVRILRADDGGLLAGPWRHEHRLLVAKLSHDGSSLLTVDGKYELRVWKLGGSPLPVNVLWQRSDVIDADFSADGALLATSDSEGQVKLLNAQNGDVVGGMDGPLPSEATPFAPASFSDGRFTESNPELIAWEEDEKTKQRRLFEASIVFGIGVPVEARGKVSDKVSVQFSADGRFLAASGTGVRVRDMGNGQVFFLGAGDRITSLEFSRDGRLMATLTGEGKIGVWDMHARTRVGDALSYEGSESINLSTDGSRLLVNGRRSAKLFEIKKDGFRAESDGVAEPFKLTQVDFRFHDTTRLQQAQISPDGMQVAAAYGDGSIRFQGARSQIGAYALELAAALQVVGGKRIDDDGRVVDMASDETLKWRERTSSRNGDGTAFDRVLRWLIADRGRRSVSPFDKLAVSEYIEREINWVLEDEKRISLALDEKSPYINVSMLGADSNQILNSAYALDPAHPLVLLALAVVEKNSEARKLWKDLSLPRLAGNARLAAKAAEMLQFDEDPEYAGKAAQIALDIEPGNTSAKAVMQWVHEQSGKKPQARKRPIGISF